MPAFKRPRTAAAAAAAGVPPAPAAHPPPAPQAGTFRHAAPAAPQTPQQAQQGGAYKVFTQLLEAAEVADPPSGLTDERVAAYAALLLTLPPKALAEQVRGPRLPCWLAGSGKGQCFSCCDDSGGGGACGWNVGLMPGCRDACIHVAVAHPLVPHPAPPAPPGSPLYRRCA